MSLGWAPAAPESRRRRRSGSVETGFALPRGAVARAHLHLEHVVFALNREWNDNAWLAQRPEALVEGAEVVDGLTSDPVDDVAGSQLRPRGRPARGDLSDDDMGADLPRENAQPW